MADKKEIKISVVIPVYNGDPYLAEAISSVLNQTYPVHEIIVVDDGSIDRSDTIARSFGPPVKVLNQVNSGQSTAMNKGIENAVGNYLAFLDSDDIWKIDKVERQINYLVNNLDSDMVFGYTRQFHSPELSEELRKKISCPPESMPAYVAPAILIRIESFLNVGVFNPELKSGEFLEWYMRALDKNLKSHILPEVVFKRRLHENNKSLTISDPRKDYLPVIKAALKRREINRKSE